MKILLYTILLCYLRESWAAQVLLSPQLTNWGTWGEFEYCPEGSKVIAAQIKVELWSGGLIDDTCLNGIKLICGQVGGGVTRNITSKVGQFGSYKPTVHSCNGNGFMTGFMLRVEEEGGAIIDETATNNLRILCSGSPNGFIELEGERWGEWTNPRICDSHEYICGLQTQVQDGQGITVDDTSLNNIRVQCCDLSQEDLLFYGIKKEQNGVI
ncbi:vitelline membrane outer layer protein 1 homolog [Folsomia candida]|nr:vitelline membrane outer layer protein 1 homolog [Folsomia candida]